MERVSELPERGDVSDVSELRVLGLDLSLEARHRLEDALKMVSQPE